jgi:hypothetical protein
MDFGNELDWSEKDLAKLQRREEASIDRTPPLPRITGFVPVIVEVANHEREILNRKPCTCAYCRNLDRDSQNPQKSVSDTQVS